MTDGDYSATLNPMRQSQLFTKTRKDAPAGEVSVSAQLLIRAGFIHKEMAGVYSFLPLGVQVMKRILKIIKMEMAALGATELFMSALQDPEVWKTTNRWGDKEVDVWFKTQLKNETEVGFGLTHEDPLTRLMKDHINSYRDLPRYAYQFQTKFRNELRAKSGLLRTREFLMNDLYSFTATTEQLDEFYDRVSEAYGRIWQNVGIADKTYKTFASGGAFTKYSHEFQTLTESGEDTIYLAKDGSMAVNKEVFTDDVLADLKKTKEDFEKVQAIEVGNIFKLGTRFSAPLGLTYTDEAGKQQPVVMGSYGIGPARVMATAVELFHDDKGIIWPKSIAPFDVHVVELNAKNEKSIANDANEIVEELEKKGMAVLHDDRDATAGQKFADSDLIGIPVRIVVSAKTLEAGKYEVKERATGAVTHQDISGVLSAVVAT